MGAGETFVYRTKESEEFVERWYDGVLERWPVEFAERRVETSYGSTYAIECGDPSAPPVILLHGVGMNSGTWREAMDVERLSARYHLFLVDIVGDIGRSLINQRPKDGGFYAEWMSEVISGLDLERTALAGASFGGAISLLTAHRRPELVTRVVAMVPIAVVCKVRLVPMIRFVFAGLFFSKRNLLGLLQYVNGGDVDTDRSAEILDLMGNFPQKKDRFVVAPLPTLSDEELRSMEVPCVCYMGERDPFYKALKVKERFDAMGCSITVDVVEGQGHLLGQDFTACLEEGLSRPLERPE